MAYNPVQKDSTMKLYELLQEAPLPSDWDPSMFDRPGTSFKAMVQYAKDRAEQVGRGSARVAFKVPYKGRDTVIKIAMNTKGLRQNEEEARLMDDWYLASLGITIPLIDYDERNSMPTWIHTEYARKISNRQLDGFFGGISFNAVLEFISNERNPRRGITVQLPDSVHDNDTFSSLRDLLMSYDQLTVGDLSRKANWGLYRGDPVILDLGGTETVLRELYGGR
jgi:hypothetical protein